MKLVWTANLDDPVREEDAPDVRLLKAAKHGEDYSHLELSRQLKKALRLQGDDESEPWIDVVVAKQEQPPFVRGLQVDSVTADNLEAESLKILEKALPPAKDRPLKASSKEPDLDFQLSPALDKVRDFLVRFVIKSTYSWIWKKRADPQYVREGGMKFDWVVLGAWEAVRDAAEARMREYVQHYGPETKIPKLRPTRKSKATEGPLKDVLLENFWVVWEDQDELLNNDLGDVSLAEAFLRKAVDSALYEIKALLKKNPESGGANFGSVSDRLRSLVRRFARWTKAGLPEASLGKWQNSLGLNCEYETYDINKKLSPDAGRLGKTLSVVLGEVKTQLGVEAALGLAERCLHWTTNKGGFGSGNAAGELPKPKEYVFKKDLAAAELWPYLRQGQDAAVERATAWRLVLEYPHEKDARVLEWFGKVAGRWADVLTVDSYALAALGELDDLMVADTAPKTNAEFYAALFKAVVDFAASYKGKIGEIASVTMEFDDFLNKQYSQHKLYMPLKLHVLLHQPKKLAQRRLVFASQDDAFARNFKAVADKPGFEFVAKAIEQAYDRVVGPSAAKPQGTVARFLKAQEAVQNDAQKRGLWHSGEAFWFTVGQKQGDSGFRI